MTELARVSMDGASAGTAATAGNTGFNSITDTGGLLSYVGRGVYGTNLCLEALSSASVGAYGENTTTGADYCAFYFYLPSLPTGDMTIASALNGTTTLAALGIISTGAVRVYSSLGTTLATTTATLSTSTWYRIEWMTASTGQEMRLYAAASGTAIEIKSGLAVASALQPTKRRFGHVQGTKALGVFDFDMVTIHSAWPALGNTAPTAAFTHGEVGLTTSVDGSTSTDFPDGIVSYDWDWGDSTTHGTGVTSSHSYSSAGTYTILLTCTDSFGSTGTVSHSVTVATGTATIDKVHPFNGTVGNTATASGENFTSITGTGLVYVTGGVSGLTAAQAVGGTGVGNFGEDNGTTSVFAGFFFRIPSAATGTTQLAAALNTSSQVAGFNIITSSGTKVQLTSTVSTTVATSTTNLTANTWYRLEWSVTSTGQTARLYLGGSGSILETLTGAVGVAFDPNKWRWGHPVGTRTADTTDIDHVELVSGGWPGMTNTTPTASYVYTNAGLTLSVDASGSSDSADGYVASYDWDWGDSSGVTHTTSTTQSHTYSTAGTYTVQLTVTDSLGATNTTSQSVTVAANVAPTAAFSHAEVGLATLVNATASADSDGTIASYDWNWGDSSAHGSGVTPAHTYATPGTYTVTLTVTDNLGATATVSHSVIVTASGLALRVTGPTSDSPAHLRGVIVAGVIKTAKVREVVGAVSGGGSDPSTYVDIYGGTY